jgi:uncharacterized OsmC-like protein
VDLRSVQKPLKEQYRNDPSASRITLKAKGGQTETPIACSVAIGRAIYNAEAHSGVGGAGTAACSGDMLLGALSACAQLSCQMVAAAMGIPTERIEVTVEGDLDLRGTLGIARDVPVGFVSIRLHFDITAPQATAEQLAGQDGTVLRRYADLATTTTTANRLGQFSMTSAGGPHAAYQN